MPEKLNNNIEKKILKRWVITSLCLIAGWLLLGWYIWFIFLLSSILFVSFILCGIHIDVPNKYLIPATYLLAITHDLIVKIFIKDGDFENVFWLLNSLSFILISFILFSLRIVQKEKNENREARREVIIKKILGLILTLLMVLSFYCITFIFTFK